MMMMPRFLLVTAFFPIFAILVLGCLAGDSEAPTAKPFAAAPPAPSSSDQTIPTWHHDVAPIVAAHCQSCHAPGEIGPFPLTSFAEAQAHHAEVAAAVVARVMPPWLPAEGCQQFRHARHLSMIEIDTLHRWSLAGAPEGDRQQSSTSSPSAPTSIPGLATLPWVDRTTDIGFDYIPQPADGPLDEWRCFVLDPNLTKNETLIGYDLVPTVRSQVHHVGFVDAPLTEARARDDASPGPGWPCPGSVDVPFGRVIGSWAGGFGAVSYADGTGMQLEAGRAIVAQIHYHLHEGVAVVPDRTRIELMFAHAPIAKEARYVGFGASGVSLPPRSSGTSLSANYAINENVMLWGLQPHMHRLGVKFHVELLSSPTTTTTTATTTTSNNGSTCMLDIPRWNYHWEELHFLDAAVPLSAGSTLRLTCTWDNPSDRTVAEGLTLDDEMCDLGMILTSP